LGERLVPLPELAIELPQALFVRLAGDDAAVLDPPFKDLEAAAMLRRVIQSEEHDAAVAAVMPTLPECRVVGLRPTSPV
jgi:hypothetical protein